MTEAIGVEVDSSQYILFQLVEVVEKFNEEICFMVETNFTCMEAMIPIVKFIELMG